MDISAALVPGKGVGQMYYSLLDAGRDHGVVLLGTVVSVDPEAFVIQLDVERRWAREQSIHYPQGSPGEARVGQRCRIQIDQGVKWTDPCRSPVERRLAGWLHPADIQPGQPHRRTRDRGDRATSRSFRFCPSDNHELPRTG